MLRIFSTHGLFGFLLIGLMITSCGGGTSSNTSSGGGGTTPTPQTLTVRVPSLNYAETILLLLLRNQLVYHSSNLVFS
jgi:hypothetical protein